METESCYPNLLLYAGVIIKELGALVNLQQLALSNNKLPGVMEVFFVRFRLP